MPTTYSDLIADIRKSIAVVSLEEIRRRLDAKLPMVLVDVREKDEVKDGYIPGAVRVPRGFLEMQIEQKVPDKSAPVVLYCAGGTRSALAARTLAELGYTHVESANPGFVRWKDLGYPIEKPPQLTDAQRDRYSRHILLPEVGEAGQAKLLASRVLLLGAGGLGSPAALYLAAAGVGTLGLVDADTVDASNLQRQILHATSRVGTYKVDSAEKAIVDLNPDVKVLKFQERLMSDNVERIFQGFDVVVDGCDNFPTRYLVNDASVFLNKPVVHGSIFRFEGQVTTFMPEERRPLLPLPLPRAPAPAPRPELPGGRRARHPPRGHRRHPGHGGHQAPPRPRQPAQRPAPHLRLPADEVRRAQAAPRQGLPGLRRPPHHQGVHRLRGLL